MSEKELIAKARLLRKVQKQIEEAREKEEALKEEFKAYMGDAEELKAGEYRISWKKVTSVRLDMAALKKALPEVAAAFTKESVSRRFSIS